MESGSIYKLLALDLDGTLTNKDKEVSARNREAIKKAQERGVVIVLASGRPVIGILKVADCLNLRQTGGYILAYNGGQIIDCCNNKDIIKQTIPMKYNHIICDVNNHYHVFALSYNSKGVICENDTDEYVRKEGYNNSVPVIRVDSLENEIKEPVVKFMVVGEPTELNEAYHWLKEKLDGKLNVFFSEPYFMEITPLGIEKASSIQRLAEVLKIDRTEIMACGDGLNDIPMLQTAGLAIVMENGYDETKKCADYIVSSNEDDGVAEAIERFILKEEEEIC